jgi:hypothetical protein
VLHLVSVRGQPFRQLAQIQAFFDSVGQPVQILFAPFARIKSQQGLVP